MKFTDVHELSTESIGGPTGRSQDARQEVGLAKKASQGRLYHCRLFHCEQWKSSSGESHLGGAICPTSRDDPDSLFGKQSNLLEKQGQERKIAKHTTHQ